MTKEALSNSAKQELQEECGVWTPTQFKSFEFADLKQQYEERRQASNPKGTQCKTSVSRETDVLLQEQKTVSFKTLRFLSKSRRKVHEYTLGEEVANALSHGIGAGLALAGLIVLIVAASYKGESLALISVLIYGIVMVAEYLMSTLYHAITQREAKRVFKILDHSFIYLFIAASYTPFCLVTLLDYNGVFLATFVWLCALVGVACEVFWVYRPRIISGVLYLALGWSVMAFLPQLAQNLAPMGFLLLALGGLSYSLGVVFYVLKKIPYMHTVFHVFVLIGSIFQYFAILLYVL